VTQASVTENADARGVILLEKLGPGGSSGKRNLSCEGEGFIDGVHRLAGGNVGPDLTRTGKEEKDAGGLNKIGTCSEGGQ